jgi:hypothetical protein
MNLQHPDRLIKSIGQEEVLRRVALVVPVRVADGQLEVLDLTGYNPITQGFNHLPAQERVRMGACKQVVEYEIASTGYLFKPSLGEVGAFMPEQYWGGHYFALVWRLGSKTFKETGTLGHRAACRLYRMPGFL